VATARAKDGRIVVPGGAYRAVVLPPLRFLRPETAEHLLALAQAGANVVSLPGDAAPDAPGLAHLSARRKQLRQAWAALGTAPGFRQGSELLPLLASAGVQPDGVLQPPGLRMERRRMANGDACYFLANRGDTPVRQWVQPARPGRHASLLDPWTGRAGRVERRADGGVFLYLEPGETRFLLLGEAERTAIPWQDRIPNSGQSQPVAGPWRVSFVAGGPVRPPSRSVASLSPYTSWPEAEMQRFAGTARYEAKLAPIPTGKRQWLLDLGEVHGSARVRLNGRDLGVCVAPPYRVALPADALREQNTLTVDVTGVAANRIRDLDRRGVVWRIFRDINFVNRNYRRFNAANWATVPAGLVGPVRLVPGEPPR
jgi:hypothetical protein